MRTGADSTGNGHADGTFEAELDQLVTEELAALRPPPSVEEPIELVLAQLAARLREHPNREALLERLQREALEAPRDTPADETREKTSPAPG